MNKELIAALAWAGGMIGVTLAAVVAKKLGQIDGDTTVRIAVGINGLMIASYGNQGRVPGRLRPPGHASGGLDLHAERAPLCRTVGVRPDQGGGGGRVQRARGGVGGDGRLWLLAAGPGESHLRLSSRLASRAA